jgi:signal transduction histidine kinase
MFLAALVMGGVLLQMFATGQMADESEPARRSAQAIATALNSTLRSSDHPQRALDAFARSLDTNSDIQFHSAAAGPLVVPGGDLRNLRGVPRWFIDLLTIPDLDTAFPVTIGGEHVGDIVFSPDLSAELFEKWAGFLALVGIVVGLTVLTGLFAWLIAESMLRPLQNLSAGIARMRSGDHSHLIPLIGPPEIRTACEQANELARTLDQLSRSNRELLHRLVSLQDDERQDLAHELHDELGPLLFGIRASTVALVEAMPPGTKNVGGLAEQMLQSIEALQQTNRRILDRLRPLYIQELGLAASIATLVQNLRRQAPQIEFAVNVDPALDRLDDPLSRTVYRVIQEGLTNVLRHARASHVHVEAAISEHNLTVEISDDGIGFAGDAPFGRGLTGMHERVRALSGTLQLLRAGRRTVVRCRLPAGQAQTTSRLPVDQSAMRSR